MGRVKLPAVYGVLTLVTGLLAGVEGLAFLSLGLSIFVPVLCCAVTERNGFLVSLAVSALAVVVTGVASEWKLAFDISSLPIVGYLICYLKRRSVEEILIASSAFLFAFAVLEELFLGTPEVNNLKWFVDVRWGFYLTSSLFFTYLTLIAATWVLKRDFAVERVRWGFFPVPFFLLGGFGTVLLKTGIVKLIAENLLVAAMGFLLVQGLSVLLFYYRKVSLTWKFILLFTLIVIPAAIFLGAIVTGLLDVWFDFRKIGKGGMKNEGNLT
ncbi:hypothetical protein SAMN06265339_0862 [Desulfurobacterium pacificum]|uniref:DUF2232 domain-containing protein n=1 Tax=Desulfurobacterium pacificum TaxID=240166 RepID=A0ABY1NJ45_9BACT|nr:hypothetical protein [Desulfurobacterium pacificum]SMP10904.1 hypothetical protein SAMN06265339_0862 [Desulfurobacterium pacificum]